MAAAIPSNGIILTEFEFTKIVQKDKLRSKINRFQLSKKHEILIESAIHAKYSLSLINWKGSYSENTRLKRAFKKLETIWIANTKNGDELSKHVSSEVFASNELFPSLFPVVEVQVKVGYVKRYLENSE